MGKRIASLLILFVLFLGLMPSISITVKATEYTSGTVNVSDLKAGDVIGNGVTLQDTNDFNLYVDNNWAGYGNPYGYSFGSTWTTPKNMYFEFQKVQNHEDGSSETKSWDFVYVTSYSYTVNVTGVSISNAPASMTVGDNSISLSATVQPDNATNKTVTWTTSNSSVLTVDNGTITPVGGGTATITATATNGTSDTSDDKTATCTITVNKKAGSISYTTSSLDKKYGDEAFTNALSHTGDSTVLYSSGNANVASVDSNGQVTIAGVGSTTITATVEDTNKYIYETKTASYTVTVSKGEGSISYATEALTKKFSDDAFTNELTKVGDGSVQYSSGNANVASVDSNGQVTITGVGSTTITANVADSDKYTYATKTASYNLTVEKGDIAVTANDVTATYDEKPHGITVTATKPSTGATIKFKDSNDEYTLTESPTITTVTESPKTVYYKVTADNYNDLEGSATITINKADSVLTTSPTGKTNLEYNETDRALIESAGTATGGTLKFSLDGQEYTDDISTITGKDAGTYKIYYKVFGDANHNDSIRKDVTVRISKIDPVYTAPVAKNLVYNGSAQELISAGTTADGSMTYALGKSEGVKPRPESFTENIPTATKIGTYTVWYKVKGDDNHNDSSTISCGETVIAAPSFAVIEGDGTVWTRGSSTGASIRFSSNANPDVASLATFSSVSVDGKKLTLDKEYSAKNGSVIITFNPTYLESLSDGVHQVTAYFADSDVYTGTATAKFSVVKKSSSSSTPSKPVDNVVTCQMAGFPSNYVWNEAQKACQAGYIDAGGNFHPYTTVKRSTVPNTSDENSLTFWMLAMLSMTAVAAGCAKLLYEEN